MSYPVYKKQYEFNDQVIEKADYFDHLVRTNRRKIFTILPNNPFSKKAGVCFTGASLELVVEELISHALAGLWKIKDFQVRHDIVGKIMKVIKAEALDHVHVGLLEGHKRSNAWVIDSYQVKKDRYGYGNSFFDLDENQELKIYTHETDDPQYKKDVWISGYLEEVTEN